MEPNIKTGYPNPNYTDEDIREGVPLEMNAEIMIDDKEYRELVAKAAALDILTARIKATGKVEDTVVYAITGTSEGEQQTEAKKYYKWWNEECRKVEKLQNENNQLRAEIEKMKQDVSSLQEGHLTEADIAEQEASKDE